MFKTKRVIFFLFPGLFLTVFHALRDLTVSLIQGTFSFAAQAPGLVTLAILFAVTALWGRFFCGYLCSFGAMQELLAFVSKKLVPRKMWISATADRILKFLKYAVLCDPCRDPDRFVLRRTLLLPLSLPARRAVYAALPGQAVPDPPEGKRLQRLRAVLPRLRHGRCGA